MLPLAADRYSNRKAAHIFRVTRAPLVARPVGVDEVERNAVQHHDSVLAKGGDQPVPLFHRQGDAGLYGLLTLDRRPGSHAPLTLQLERLAIEAPHQHHVSIETTDLIGFDLRHQRIVDATFGVEDLDPLRDRFVHLHPRHPLSFTLSPVQTQTTRHRIRVFRHRPSACPSPSRFPSPIVQIPDAGCWITTFES